MGILADNVLWIRRVAPPPKSMLELGNQYLCVGHKPYPEYPDRFVNPNLSAPIAAKPYFQLEGYDHVSIDLNGQDGALVRDLSQPFSLGRTFDVATDFGTSEHVSCLWQCLRNVHEHLALGGLVFYANPAPKNWPKHGYWYRDSNFYGAFAAASGYALLEVFPLACAGNTVDGWLTCALMRKTTEAFVTKDAFYALPLCRE